MDIIKILSMLNENNIDLGEIIKIVTSIFGSQNNTQQTNQSNNFEQQNATPPQTDFNQNSTYWELPKYDFNPQNTQKTNTMHNTMQSIVPNKNNDFEQKNANFSQKSSPTIDIAQLIKIVLPLLQRKQKDEETSSKFETKIEFQSEILKLKKTD
ncbi:MAG: hypothetical protein J6C13_02825 [Clostridia bacterium]|nr:hypothetical protein [Clostridia bacterium]